ncbi:MAG TPA: hypothetical protein ENI85_07795 [Deltaproteobacteria bacterium]|nr:hypothetical protein [Deltaproteobacteria bacterium]
MEWSRSWAFWRREIGAGPDPGTKEKAFRREPRSRDEWEARLIERGVSSDSAARVSERLLAASRELGRGSAASLMRGAVLAFEAQADLQEDVERNLRDVREVERLLGAFTGELEKLDEVLEVLAAYAQRMRTRPARSPRRVLH